MPVIIKHPVNVSSFVQFSVQQGQEGIIGWKKAYVKSNTRSKTAVLVRLLIPSGTMVHIGRGDGLVKSPKLRASQAWVLGFHDLKGNPLPDSTEVVSSTSKSFGYTPGTVAVPHTFDGEDRGTCAGGIHFFLLKDDAIKYRI